MHRDLDSIGSTVSPAAPSPRPPQLPPEIETLQQNAALCSAPAPSPSPILTPATPASSPNLQSPISNPKSQIPSLSPRQLTAINLILMGRSLSTIAYHLGLDRSTVSRWRNANPLFIAELNRRQREICDSAANRLRCLLLQSLQIIDQQLHGRYIETRTKAAFRLLPLVTPRTLLHPSGPTDPNAILDDLIRSHRQLLGQDPSALITPDERESLLASLTTDPDSSPRPLAEAQGEGLPPLTPAPDTLLSPSPGTPGEGRGEGPSSSAVGRASSPAMYISEGQALPQSTNPLDPQSVP